MHTSGSYGDDLPCSEETSDDGWIRAENIEEFCYMKLQEPRNWHSANDHCIHHGGHLASIHSTAENDFITGDYWIGLIKVNAGGQRHWSDGTSYDFNNWADGGMHHDKTHYHLPFNPDFKIIAFT